jgi:cadmium resistance protein CadD (predicted permease)
MIGLIIVAIAAYASTNIDDLLLLCGFFAHPAYSSARAAVVIPLPYIGLLGFAPIFLGCSRFLAPFGLIQRPPSSRRRLITVATATVADGGDNIATYIPIFAGTDGADCCAVIAVFSVLTGLWCWIACIVTKHPVVERMFRAWSTRLLPYMLIALGLIVLWRNGSFGLI